MDGQTIQVDNSIQISGREVARQTVKYMRDEVANIDRRNNRY